MGISVLTLILSAACLALTYHFASRLKTVRRLSHVPGPASASWSLLWLTRRQLGGRLARDLAQLSRQYGPIFRIGPNSVVISDPFEVRRVWQARGPARRSRWYEMFRFDQPVETVLSQRDNGAHAALRAKLLPGYSGKDVDNLHSVIDGCIAEFVSLIERKYLSTESVLRPMDLAEKAQFLTLDIISTLAVGTCFGCVSEDRDTYGQLSSVTGSVPLVVVMANIPDSFMLLQNPISRALLPKDKMEGVKRMMGMAQKNAAARYGPDKIHERDMLGSFVNHGLPYTNAWLETFGQIGAGSDTTATAIRMTILFLITNPHSYGSLLSEIDAAVEGGRVSSPITDDQAKKMPYLQAVIKEGLRVWPPVAGLMPKIFDSDQVVCGKELPAGTEVSWAAIPTLRNKEVFGHDAECFRPGRWVDEPAKEGLAVMEQVLMLCFGAPSRWECLGKTIALVELNKVFFEIFKRFDISLVDPITPLKTYDASLSIQSDLWVRIQRRR
ncbi:putative cytochrome P450 E-class, group I [Podospora conica]|nr:putative cytochrome P450 E-class, group I [Schizothecium conicum]